MGERRTTRGHGSRTDRQILDHQDDVEILRAIAAQRLTVQPTNRMDLKRLAREDLCLAGFGVGTTPTLLPRGLRLLAVVHGEVAGPPDDL